MKNNFANKFIKYFLGNIASKILYFVFGILAARIYGVSIYGEYNYALSIVAYFIMFANLGIQGYAQFAVSKEPQKAKVYYNEVITIEIILGVVATFLLYLFTLIVTTSRGMVLLVGSTIIISALNIDWLFFAKQESQNVSIQQLITYCIQLILLGLAYLSGSTQAFLLPVLVSIGQFIGNIYLHVIGKYKFDIKYSFTVENWKLNIKKGIPYLFSGVFAGINCNIDSIIIANIMDSEAVGAYSAAYKIINIFMVLLATIYAPMFPILVQSLKSNIDKYREIINRMRKISAIFIFPCVTGGVILGNQLIEFMYGLQYQEASEAFKILLLFVGVFYMREVYGYTLTALGEQKKYMTSVCISSVINILLNIFFIPIWGIEGAALTTLISELVNFIFMRYNARKLINAAVYYKTLFNIGICTFIMLMFTYVFKRFNVHVVLNILFSAVIYIVDMLIFKVIKIVDLKKIKSKL